MVHTPNMVNALSVVWLVLAMGLGFSLLWSTIRQLETKIDCETRTFREGKGRAEILGLLAQHH